MVSIFYRIKDSISDLKFRCQRFLRGWADIDCWDIDYWFLNTIVPMLTYLKNNLHSHPVDITEEEWKSILEKMIECFTEANEDTCSHKNRYEEEYMRYLNEYYSMLRSGKLSSGIENKHSEISDKYLSDEMKILNYREEKLHEGLELFSDWFNDLWD